MNEEMKIHKENNSKDSPWRCIMEVMKNRVCLNLCSEFQVH